MGTKKSDCVAMFPESIEKVQEKNLFLTAQEM